MSIIPNPFPLTLKQMNIIRVRYRDGEVCRVLAAEVGVKTGWLYWRLRDIRKNNTDNYEKPIVISLKKIKAPNPEWTIRQMRVKCPHFLLYLFASGQLDDAQMSEITTRSLFLEQELSEVSMDRCLSEVVRDHPLLLLRTMVRFETWDIQKSNKGNVRRCPQAQTADIDPYELVGQVDHDRFDPESELMRDIARLAMGFALN